MSIIKDIRVYRCAVPNVAGVNPEAFANPGLQAVASRICMKLRECEFSLGDFDHLYINLSTCLAEGDIRPAAKEPDRYHPWYRYYDVGISKEFYGSLEKPDCVPTVALLIEKVLKTRFSTSAFDGDRISECVNEAVTQGEAMLMKYKEKISSQRRAVLYLRYLDNGKYFPLLRVYDNEDNILLEEDLPESQTLDPYGQISVSSKRVTINPRKSSWTGSEPIVFNL
ncbi:hypothetical protein SAMN06296952_0030 [Oscillospiraceae bacterium]|nr:hypothetical protein SAMN06296952_0030 [Oscillospiraceae bacterium]